MVSSKSEQRRIQPDTEPDRQESARCNSRQRRLLVSLSAIDPNQSFLRGAASLKKGAGWSSPHHKRDQRQTQQRLRNIWDVNHSRLRLNHWARRSLVSACSHRSSAGMRWSTTAVPVFLAVSKSQSSGDFASNLPSMYHATSVARPVFGLTLIRILSPR
jgi:hypothetical protein